MFGHRQKLFPHRCHPRKHFHICNIEPVTQDIIRVNRVDISKQFSQEKDTPLPPPISDVQKKRLLEQLKINVPDDEKSKYVELFMRNYDVFSTDKHDLGRANNFEHTIKLKSPEPIYRKQFRIPESHRDALYQQIDEWLKIGIIEPCFSRFNSPIFIVPKKDGTFRFVLDYRALNSNSLDDRYSMKDVSECIGEIGRAGSSIFSLMDLTSGFWQMPLDKSSRSYTAFTVPGKGQFQYNVVSMGLKGGPGSFQRMMELAMCGLYNVIVYIDDLLLHTRDHPSHREHLQKMFNRLRNINIKLNAAKCTFGATDVNYLGFRLTPKGILPGTDKLKAVRDMPPPSSVTHVRQFLGLCNYFRTHVRNFAQISSPLNRLTSKKTGWAGGPLPPDAKAAFHTLKAALCSNPVVAYPKITKPFILIVDAATGGADSNGGFGAILGQNDENGNLQVTAYASRSLKDHEKNYTPYLAEMNAAAWAIDHFDVYLRGRKFTLFTDHKPLETLKTIHQKTLNRLQERMSMYDFDLKYKKGSEMPADILSRQPVNAIDTQQVTLATSSLADGFCRDLRRFLSGARDFSHRKLVILEKIGPYVTDTNGILTITIQNHSVIILPRTLIPDILEKAHGTLLSGHGSIDKTMARLQTQYYWPYMKHDVADFISSCDRCQKSLKTTQRSGTLNPLPLCTSTNQRVHCDLFGPLKTISSKAHVLCITDAHSKFVELAVVPNKEARTVAAAIFRQWICRFGIPDQILTDGGKEFCNSVFTTLCEFLSVDKQKTTPAHPQCNAQAEVVNKTIKKYLAAMTQNSLEWEDLIPTLAFSYNTTKHRTIGMTPAELMLGYLPRSMIGKEIPQYNEDPIMDTLRQFATSRALANSEALRQTERYKQDHDKNRSQPESFHVGQFVLLDRRLFVGENEKLADKWEGPYIVLKVLTNGVVDILRKGRTIRVNKQRLKAFHALGHVRPNYDLPETQFDKLEDLSGSRESLFLKEDKRSTDKNQLADKDLANDETEILVKTDGLNDIPVSSQETPFGRHPMVLRKKSSLKNITSILLDKTSIHHLNHQLVAAYARNINYLADAVLLDEFGLPTQVRGQDAKIKVARRRAYLKSLSPAKRNALLTGDPLFSFDPLAYEYVWAANRPSLTEDQSKYFEHLPEVKEFKNEFKQEIKEEIKPEPIEEDTDSYEDADEPQSLWPPQDPFSPPPPRSMVEDPTFYAARSHPSSEDDTDDTDRKAPRHGEYTNPWKFPWTYPKTGERLTKTQLRQQEEMARLESSAFRINPHGSSPEQRPSRTALAKWTPAGGFMSSPSSARRLTSSTPPRTPAGPSGRLQRTDTPGASARIARLEWSGPGTATPELSSRSTSFRDASTSQRTTTGSGSTPITDWSQTSANEDMDHSSLNYITSLIDVPTMNIGINSLDKQDIRKPVYHSRISWPPYSTRPGHTGCPPTYSSFNSWDTYSTPMTTPYSDSDSETTPYNTRPVLRVRSRRVQTSPSPEANEKQETTAPSAPLLPNPETPTTPTTTTSSPTETTWFPPINSLPPMGALVMYSRAGQNFALPVVWKLKTRKPVEWELQPVGEPISIDASPSTHHSRSPTIRNNPLRSRSTSSLTRSASGTMLKKSHLDWDPEHTTSMSCLDLNRTSRRSSINSLKDMTLSAPSPTPSRKNSVRWKDSPRNTVKESWKSSHQPSRSRNMAPPEQWKQSWWNLSGEQLESDVDENETGKPRPIIKVSATDHLRAFLGDNNRLRLIQKARLLQQLTAFPN